LIVEWLFWICAIVVGYVYVGYPLLLAALVKLRSPRAVARDASHTPFVTLFVSAYNEENVIREKLENALALDYPRDKLEIVVISDASSDGTDAIVREYAARGVTLLRMSERTGKTLGLNAGVAAAKGEVLVFSDANAIYDSQVIRLFASCFADPAVGAVTGESRYRPGGGEASAQSEGAYWKYEQRIKRLESAVGSLIGGDGAIYAVRRALFRPLRADDLSDFVNPMQVVGLGYRNVYEPAAVCYEEAGETFAKEYRRKVRIVNRGWRATMRLSRLLNPARHGVVALQLFSHKVLRWLVPVLLVGLLIASVALAGTAPFYQFALIAQLVCYAAAAVGALWSLAGAPPKWLAVPYYFCLMNAASLQGIVEFYAGRNYTTWTTVRQT
jgi:cellulose synthase/poly-beta-1,6-N-acetylglucosamine synthase-like glycosyltransferase